jgi:hypothetical protein
MTHPNQLPNEPEDIVKHADWPGPVPNPNGGWNAIKDETHDEEGFHICPLCGEPMIPGVHPRDVCPNSNWRRISTIREITEDHGWEEV